MFEVEKVAKNIREARIRKNMTQSNLADELGVSYQAVSNWERGNSMPDVSQYEDLCRILETDLESLLGFSSDTATVSRFLGNGTENAEITAEELTRIAPLLPPDQLKEKTEHYAETKQIDMNVLCGLAPFLDQETLGQMIAGIVQSDAEITMDMLIAMAPFPDRSTLEMMAAKVTPTHISELHGVAPFVSPDVMEMLYDRLGDQEELSVSDVMGLAPFFSGAAVDRMAEKVTITCAEELDALMPWVSGRVLSRLAKKLSSEY
ncbi:MAG: helix-turn-helix transcriptional regulator [Lachnospiraceae bacterium]|nr:helix-turn-helix transcriptional regulator [Lachnospiraceae bacterium]